ncbi:MAG: FecR family protein [Cruoricaptor ignavus]|nr:FecR family protein [Cruoricaptor ignavus]
MKNKHIENWEKTKHESTEQISEKQSKILWANIHRQTIGRKNKYRFSAIAATLLLFLGLSFWWFQEFTVNDTNLSKTENHIETITAGQDKHQIYLPDGSRVVLYPKTALQYSKNMMNEESRNVTITGKAEFEIKKSSTPFLVKLDETKVEVLGTKFLIDYEKDYYTVELYEGKVAVQFGNGKKDYLLPNQKWTYHTKDKNAEIVAMSEENLKEIVAKDKPLELVITDLEQMYNVKISTDKNIKNLKISGKIYENNIEDNLKALVFPFGLKYKKINDTTYHISK